MTDIGKSIAEGAKAVLSFIGKHQAEILLGSGIAGGVATVVLGIRAGHLAERELTQDKDAFDGMAKAFDKCQDAGATKLARVEYHLTALKYTWQFYVPPVLSATASILCFTGAYSSVAKQNMKLASACVAAETLVTQYQDQFVEPKNAQERKRNSQTDDQFLEEAAKRYDLAYGVGDCVFFDAVTGMIFRSTEHDIKSAEAELAKDLAMGCEYVTILDLYEHIPYVDYEMIGEIADKFGWVKNGAMPNISFTARFVNGKPVGVLHYNVVNLDRIFANDGDQ